MRLRRQSRPSLLIRTIIVASVELALPASLCTVLLREKAATRKRRQREDELPEQRKDDYTTRVPTEDEGQQRETYRIAKKFAMKIFRQVYVPCRASRGIETLKRSAAFVATTRVHGREIIINNRVDVDITSIKMIS